MPAIRTWVKAITDGTAVTSFLVVTCLGVACVAQPVTSDQRTAFVDISRLIRRNDHFVKAIGKLREDAEAFRQRTERDRRQLATRAKDVQRLAPDREVFNREQAELAKQRLALLNRIASQQQLRAEEERRIYSEAYEEAIAHLRIHCQNERIRRVVRYDGRVVRGNNSSADSGIGARLLNPHHQDITQPLLHRINAGTNSGLRLGNFSPADLPQPVRFLSTASGAAAKRVLTSRAAWALDQLVFPEAS